MNPEHLEDLYPLSPLQQGMLFHTLEAPDSGVCFEQDTFLLRGDLDVQRFTRAWEHAVSRHAALRTSFLWEDIEEPHQLVHRRGVVDLRVEDWRDLSERQREQLLERYRAEQRRKGFDLAALPLLRFGLFRVAADQYWFVWNYHHAILDGWSIPLVMRDVLAIYENEGRGGSVALPTPRPYREFIGWLLQQDLARAEAHWRGRLDGFAAPTDLTVGRRASSEDSGAATGETFQRVLRTVPARVSSDLATFARANRLTLSTLIYGAWALLLSRYATAEEVVFGCNVSGRPPELPDVGEMVGLFINTLPLRIATDPNTPLLPWLKSLQGQLIETLELDYSPLVQVQKWSQVPGGQSLFDSIVVVENFPAIPTKAGGALKVEYLAAAKHSQTGYPLTLVAWPGDELALEIKYDRRRFDSPTIERMLGHLEVLLGAMVKDPDRCLGELPILSDRERTELIEGVRRPLSPAPRIPADGGATLHALFEAQVERQPSAIAVSCDDRSLTYAELNAKANRLARRLIECGVQPDTLVGLCLDRSNHLVVAILAILKAGGAYLPIDLSYPADRLAFMLEDAQAPVLLTETKLGGNLPSTHAKVLCVDEVLAEQTNLRDEENLPSLAGPDNLTYVIYTSGTTGKPKGSLITHRNAVRLFSTTEHWYGFTERDVWTLFHSYAFDFSVWEIWGALLYGGRVVVVPFMVSRSPEAFYELLAREQVTVLNQTPSAFRQLIQAEEAVGQKELALRYVIFGGEALEMQSLRPWFERHGDRKPQLVNMYGITETTVHVTYRPLTMDDLDSGSVIGVPLPDLQIYILDPQRRPVPIGVPGEMYVGGAGLARGYLRRPELTTERFIDDQLTGRQGARLYRTGDLARFLPGWDIEYLGRIDDQVKIRGFRIELGEIESVLCEHPAIREAAVMAREDIAGTKRLVAYLVVAYHATATPPETTALREHLKKKLPDYMVPAAFVFLDKLPLTANGKINRAALPAPENRPELASSYLAPRTPAEEKLAAIWSKVLRLERVGVNDNFFELGGDSILSIQIISLARREGLKLTPKLLFAHQTIAELARMAGVVEEVKPQAQDVAGDLPLTPIQKWFFEQNLEEAYHYNQSFLFEVAEPMDRALLEEAVKHLGKHHDALRLRYARQAGDWRQFYSTAEDVPLSWVNLAGDAQPQLAIEAEASSAQASLNLEDGPLWRVVYLDLGRDLPARLLMVIHHLAVDGVSWRPLLEDLETAYLQLKAGKSVQLPAKTASFKEWAQRLQQFAHSQASGDERSYWNKILDDARANASTPLSDASENTEAAARTLKISLTGEETQALLQQVPAAYNTQINDVLLTALARAWRRWSGQGALYTNLEGHGRENLFDDVDVSRTTGWFTSIFPVRLDLPDSTGGWQPGEALKSVKEQLRQIPRRGIGYGILRYLGAEASLAPAPEPKIVFNYLGQFDQVVAGSKLFRFASESTGAWHAGKQRRRHALEANSLVIDGRMEFWWTYSASQEAAISQLAGEFAAALRELISHCQSLEAWGRTPSDFPLARLDQSTLDQLIGARRDIEDVYPLSPIQTLFASANPALAETGFDQWHCALHGDLDVSAFERAWQETVRRHTILRTTVHTDGLREPVQMVHRDVRLPWTIEDWSIENWAIEDRTIEDWTSTPANQHAERWSAFLKSDRARPLRLTEAPAMRFALIRLSGETWKFLWSIPAMLLDGWSWPLVFRDVSRSYESLSRGVTPQFEPIPPYRRYIEWLSEQKSEEPQQFWRERLAGFREPTPLPGELPEQIPSDERYVRHTIHTSPESTSALQSVARRLQLTLNTLVQGAWALQLSRQSGRADVVFGSAFSGRPADLPGVESIAGPFVNNLPVRVAVDPGAASASFFRELHTRLLELSPHQFTPLMEIQRCSEVPWRYRLFDSVTVFQNYLVDDSARNLGEIKIADFCGPIHTNYPIMLLAEPGVMLDLTLIYDRQSVARTTVERWSGDLAILFEQLPAYLDRPVAELQGLLSPPAAGVPRPKRKWSAQSQNFVPPQTEMERAIAAVWQKMFGLEQISIEENFFDLGGYSILLLQMHKHLREALKTEFPIVTLFEYPTIGSLARRLDHPAKSGSENGEAWRDRAERQKRALAGFRVALRK